MFSPRYCLIRVAVVQTVAIIPDSLCVFVYHLLVFCVKSCFHLAVVNSHDALCDFVQALACPGPWALDPSRDRSYACICGFLSTDDQTTNRDDGPPVAAAT